ncbi:DUF2972 domain-containing protein [Helicobacter rodentium]|nr:DUF2972 domain-containing protein [Helicobacter rodentium]
MHKLKSQENDSLKIESFFSKLFSQIPFSAQTPFLLKYQEEILQWLNSKEFKEKYINTNHPYPPLLNPERLNAKVESCKDNKLSVLSLRGTNKVRDKAIHNVAYFKDSIAESRMDKIMDCHEAKAFCNNECQSKSAESIQPYPNLSYESIPPELAWDLNLPLPPYYGFVWIGGHGVGMAAMTRFFHVCNVNVSLIWVQNIRVAYISRYNYAKTYKTTYAIFNVSEAKESEEFTKYLSLMPKEIPILWSVRDPIGLLKHALGVDWAKRWWRGDKEVQKTFNLTYNWNKYIEWLEYNKPAINPNFESMKSNIFIMNALSHCFNIDKVYYLDMSAISQERAFETMKTLSEIFGFSPPNKEAQSAFNYFEFRGNLRWLLPLKLYANKADIFNIYKKGAINQEDLQINEKDSVVLNLTRILNNTEMKNILPNIFQSDLCNDMGIYVNGEHLEILEKDKEFYEAVKEYLRDFCQAIKTELDRTEQVRIKEIDVLDYLKENKQKRIELKNLLDKELKHIKANRPDIVESWKYYQEFERMCEELD